MAHTLITSIKISSLILLIATIEPTFATTATQPQNKCAIFDSIALQLAFAPNNTPSPLNIEQIQNSLGFNYQETSSTIATYSWIHKNRVLIVKTNGDAIIYKILTGSGDGSIISKKMDQIYETLKSATSIWSIKNIQQQLGAGQVTHNKLQHTTWNCSYGALTITIDQNKNIITATASYQAPSESIETRLGLSHPMWDIKTDSLGGSYRSWQRSFQN